MQAGLTYAGNHIKMRRKDREVRDYNEMLGILDRCDVLRIGFNDGEYPYIVPVNFGYEDIDGQLYFYFHGAAEGRKIGLIKQNNGAVCFELDTDHSLVDGDTACDYTYCYRSIMGEGHIEILDDPDARIHGLRMLMAHYGGAPELKMDMGLVKHTAVLRLKAERWSCKKHVI